MRKTSASFLLSAVIVLGLAGPLKAEVIIVNASTAGWINNGGRNVSGAGVGNYFLGNCGLNDCRTGEHRNFFEFEIPDFFGTVSSARLTLDTYGVMELQAPSLTYRVTSIPPTFRFSDLGNGLVYGNRNYSYLDAYEPRTIALSSAALAAIQPLTTFRIGGRVTSPTRYGPDEPTQGVFAGSGGFGGSGPGGFQLVQLEIATGTPAPSITGDKLLASTGTALGNAVNYYKANEYAKKNQELEDCAEGKIPNCDLAEIYSERNRGFSRFSSDVVTSGVAINGVANGFAVNSAAVDTTVWDGTLVGKVVNFGEFVEKIYSSIRNAIDFSNALESQPQADLKFGDLGTNSEPVIIKAIVGDIFWKESEQSKWILYDLEIEADILKEYFADASAGQTLGSIASIYPSSNAFGVITIENVIDPLEYNTVYLSLRQVEVVSDSEVSEPTALAIFFWSLLIMGAGSRCGRS